MHLVSNSANRDAFDSPPEADRNPTEHPMVDYIRRRAESLLALVRLEQDGHPVEPDGFRLINLSSWKLSSYTDVFAALGPLSGACNLRCAFCYENGNVLPRDRGILSEQEANTRLRYFDRETRKGLPAFRIRYSGEPFTNREWLSILQKARECSRDTPLTLTTNGSLLDAEVVSALPVLSPIWMIVSINAAQAERRKALMKDNFPKRAYESLTLLREKRIPFIGSVVAWPDLPIGELAETVLFLDRQGAAAVRVSLPGYSRHISRKPCSRWRSIWSSVSASIRQLRNSVRAPILLSPALYAERPLVPEIAGIVPASPAEKAGLRTGDTLLRIAGNTVASRTHAQQLLVSHCAPCSRIACEALRDGTIVAVEISMPSEGNDDCYPFWPQAYPMPTRTPFGIWLYDDFDPLWLAQIARRIEEYDAKRVLLFCSELLVDTVSDLLETVPELQKALNGRCIQLEVPEQRFWGGNIILGDLWMVSDLIHAFRKVVSKFGHRPDLVVLPSTFMPDGWADLCGEPWSSFEHATGCPVEPIFIKRIAT